MKSIPLLYFVMVFMLFSCQNTHKAAVNPMILETVYDCHKDFVDMMNDTSLWYNKYLDREYDSINISLFFYLDSYKIPCYDVFAFHRLANDSISLIGYLPIDEKSILLVYDASGLSGNFIDTTQLLKPWTSRLDHGIKYTIPERISPLDEPIVEGVSYRYIGSFELEIALQNNSIILKKIKPKYISAHYYYTFYNNHSYRIFSGLEN